MKAFIKKMILRIFHDLKINEFYARRLSHDGVYILAYHEVERSNFATHINYLKSNGFKIVSMDILADYWEKKKSLPPKSIALTFDDGWQSNYSQVFPVASAHQIPVLIYLVSQIYVSGIKPLFFILAELISAGIKNVPDEESLARMDDHTRNNIISQLKTDYNNRVNRSHSLSVEEIKEMLNSGFVSFGSHTATHPDLNNITETEVKKEIFESKTDLELFLNQSIDHFAYPKGCFLPQHFDIIKNAGYKTAVTTVPGWNNPEKGTSPFELRRIFMSAKDDVSVLAAKLSGLWYKMHHQKMNYSS